jgi:hypothetical protein
MAQSATTPALARARPNKIVTLKRAIAVFGGILIAPIIGAALAFVAAAAIVPLLLVLFPLCEALLSRDGRSTWRAPPTKRVPAHA